MSFPNTFALQTSFVTHPSLRESQSTHSQTLISPPRSISSDIRDAHDAHVVLEAVRLNVLPLIKRRLVASERERLTTGNVFVWEEAEDEGGLLRWTDGRRWCVVRPLIDCTLN
jgi:hypothetical protein